MNNRRHFLTNLVAGAGFVGLGRHAPPLFARAAEQAATKSANADRVLVVLFLRGGNDGLNTVVPKRDPLYHKFRQACRIAPERTLSLGEQAGLHPSLRGLADLWNKGSLAIVQGVGYPRHNRSHFVSTAIWHAARTDARPGAFVGWLGRALDDEQLKCAHPLGFSVGLAETPEPLRGRNTRTAVPPAVANAEARRLAQLFDGYRTGVESALAQHVAEIRRDAAHSLRQLSSVSAPTSGFPATALGQQLAQVAWLISDRNAARVYYLEHDGYDTHAAQPERHSMLLHDLGDAIKHFISRLKKTGDARRTTMLVFSEFGRRVPENDSAGTDHGSAGPVFLVGDAVRGGHFGNRPDLERLVDGDVAVTTDFRRIYATLLESVIGANADRLLGEKFQPMDLLSA